LFTDEVSIEVCRFSGKGKQEGLYFLFEYTIKFYVSTLFSKEKFAKLRHP